jgi:hypothetical protein
MRISNRWCNSCSLAPRYWAMFFWGKEVAHWRRYASRFQCGSYCEIKCQPSQADIMSQLPGLQRASLARHPLRPKMRRREFIALVGGQRCGRCLHLWNDWKAERCSPFFTVAGGCARLH